MSGHIKRLKKKHHTPYCPTPKTMREITRVPPTVTILNADGPATREPGHVILMPPPPGACPLCAVPHEPWLPHDLGSLGGRKARSFTLKGPSRSGRPSSRIWSTRPSRHAPPQSTAWSVNSQSQLGHVVSSPGMERSFDLLARTTNAARLCKSVLTPVACACSYRVATFFVRIVQIPRGKDIQTENP